MATLLHGNNYEPRSFFTTSVRCQTEKTEENVKIRECVKKMIERLNNEMDSVVLSEENIDFGNNHLYLLQFICHDICWC